MEQVTVDGVAGFEGRIWQNVVLSKVKQSDEFIFQDDELQRICDGKISWADFEITDMDFKKWVKLTLIRETTSPVINLTFLERGSVLKFLQP